MLHMLPPFVCLESCRRLVHDPDDGRERVALPTITDYSMMKLSAVRFKTE